MVQKDRSAIGGEILLAAQNELYMAFPYLDAALCALRPEPGDSVTLSIATDGERLCFNSDYLMNSFLRSETAVNRVYLHVILHCMLRHLAKKQGRDPVLWDLACDAAVENLLDRLGVICIDTGSSPKRRKFYGECRQELRVLTAEGIYRTLQRERRSEYELASLQRAFLGDDHVLWDPEKNGSREQSERQDEQWKNLSDRTGTAMETVFSTRGTGGEAVLEQVRIAAADDVDYRAFLRRFSAPREILETDGDAFDYIYYTYGLQRYGNMPLVEPPETKEDRRIEDFVIAIDTSMSTSGQLVRDFLRCTYSILRSTETFTRKLNIRILQCDDTLRSDTVIRSVDELHRYMEHVSLHGGSATDFRPVFEHVEELRNAGAFTALRGLLYFSDGMGIYPKKRPSYETAFILPEAPPAEFGMPPWIIRVPLSLPRPEQAGLLPEEDDEEREEMPEL